MSAIYGIINKDGKPVDPEMVQKMKQAMKHRAKDGGAEWMGDNAAFGFCHLIVYPNQEHEKLPLENGDLVITANAHLHNREELIKKLGVDTKQYATTPDSYLILKAFEKWGADCVQHLDGEYVYAIWNKVSKELFISNDHIGFKALYYYDTPEQFIFCSEIKGIEAVKVTPNYFDDRMLSNYLFDIVGEENSFTYNKEIKAITTATKFTLHGKHKRERTYWELSRGNSFLKKDEEWEEALRELIISSITKRVVYNSNIGLKLSGGLDSSCIAFILASILKEKNLPLHTFTSVPINSSIENEGSDIYYVKRIVKQIDNIIPEYVDAKCKRSYDNLDYAFHADESFPNILHYMDHAILEVAAKKKLNQLFTGFGGDFTASSPRIYLIKELINSFKFNSAFRAAKFKGTSKQQGLGKVLMNEYIVHTPLWKKLKFIIENNHFFDCFTERLLNKSK
jgi:asparagine synthase (glutamine-hydrolysing)